MAICNREPIVLNNGLKDYIKKRFKIKSNLNVNITNQDK